MSLSWSCRMLNFGKPHSYSQILSALIAFCFSFSAAGQNIPGPPQATRSEALAPHGQQQENAIGQQQRSIAIQQQSVERQRAAIPQQSPHSIGDQPGTFRFTGAVFAAAPPDCPPVSPMVLESVVHRAAAAYNVEPNLINAVIRQESGGFPCAVSEKGAMGLMQLMPEPGACSVWEQPPSSLSQECTQRGASAASAGGGRRIG